MSISFSTPARLPLTRYELPEGGTSLLGYVVRRMHKTALLVPAQELLAAGQTGEALAQVALYAAGASASFGPAFYQPRLDPVGRTVTEVDPATGACVRATLDSRSLPYRISYSAELPGGGLLTGHEEITGTQVGLRGLGMPAPSRFAFTAEGGDYVAEMVGVIVSELAPAFLRPWRIRAYGSLDLHDNAGNRGTLSLNRSGEAGVAVFGPDERAITKRYNFAAGR
jgi:hypothetical protein